LGLQPENNDARPHTKAMVFIFIRIDSLNFHALKHITNVNSVLIKTAEHKLDGPVNFLNNTASYTGDDENFA
jgi:hypothetical protein